MHRGCYRESKNVIAWGAHAAESGSTGLYSTSTLPRKQEDGVFDNSGSVYVVSLKYVLNMTEFD